MLKAEQYFGCPLGKQDVQAVWLKVHNQTDQPIELLLPSIDPQYFSLLEVAYANHRPLQDNQNAQLDEFFERSRFPAFVKPGEIATGFIFTTRSEGAKFVNVEFWHSKGLTREGFHM